MYREQFITQLMTKIEHLVPAENLEQVRAAVDISLEKYTVSARETSLVVYTNTFPDVAKSYLVTKKIEGLSPNSLNLYTMVLKDFFITVSKAPEEITSSDIRIYLYKLQNKDGVSLHSVETKRTIIACFFKWAAEEGYIPANPCRNIKPIKFQKKEREPLSSIELEKLKNSCTNIRDRAIVEFFYSTGCRVSEVVNIKLNDIDFQNGEVTVLGKGNKYRKTYISAKAMMYLLEYLKSRNFESDSLFCSERSPHKALTKDGIERIIKMLGKAANISRPVFPHLLRHTAATDCLQRGMDITEIQRFLGHTNVSTALIYAKLNEETLKMNHERCLA